MIIAGLQKTTLIDYPGKIACIIFLAGCNFRCPYCHNPELVENITTMLIEENVIFKFLKTRMGKLDGVVITVGEPTLQKDLKSFIARIKSLGFLVKLDTNGTNPKMLQELIDEKLIDYVAMDIKAPIDEYSKVVCAKVETAKIIKSIEILKVSDIDYEFRTTVVKSQLRVEDFESIGKMIEGAQKYYLQKFVPTKILDKSFISQKTFTDSEFVEIVTVLKKYVKQVIIR